MRMRFGVFGLILVVASLPTYAADAPKSVTLDLVKQLSGTSLVLPPGTYNLTILNTLPTVAYKVNDLTLPAQAPQTAPADKCKDSDAIATTLAAALGGAKNETDIATKADETRKECPGFDAAKFTKALADLTTRAIKDVALEVVEKKNLTVTITRPGATWIYMLTGAAAPKPTDDKGTGTDTATKPKDSADDINKKLNELLDLTRRQPDLVTKECKWSVGCTGDPIYVNADHVATVYITGIPTTENAIVRVSAGEEWTCEGLRSRSVTFNARHDTIAVPLQMRARFPLPFGYFRSKSDRDKYGLALYGIDRNRMGADKKGKEHLDECNYVAAPDPNISAIPFLVQGAASVIFVEVTVGDTTKTFNVPVRYMRFWLDAGGFFSFAQQRDEDVIKRTGTDNKTIVSDLRSRTDLNASTGIVVNIHPGNFPSLAWQFGIATQSQRQPSYYLGMGVRARELGTRALATFAVGMAAVQVDRFPGLRKEIRRQRIEQDNTRLEVTIPSDSPLLIAKPTYMFTPYISVSLGFSFGGVSDKTNVAAGVSTTP